MPSLILEKGLTKVTNSAVEFVKSSPEYAAISRFYGDRKATRSKVRLMKHIDDGLVILESINASPWAMFAWCLHPIFQEDKYLKKVDDITLRNCHWYSVMLAMEYRATANAYLSHMSPRVPDLSPLKDVNDMLIADKKQNYADFMKYHRKTHKRAKELESYFHLWFTALGVSP